MGRTIFLCLSTFHLNSNLSAENRIGPNYWCHPSFLLADTALVYHASTSFDGQPSFPASVEPSPNTTSQQHSTPSSQAVKADGLQGFRESLQQCNISGKAATITLLSCLDWPQKQYKLYLKQWIDFCCKRQADP